MAFAILSYRKGFIFKNYIKVLNFVFIYTIYTYWITLFLPTGLHTILIVLLTSITLNYTFLGTLFKSLIKTFSIIIGMSIIEILIALLFMFIKVGTISEILQNDLYVLICSIIAKSIEIIVLIIIYKRDLNISWLNDSNPYQSKYKQILIIISTVLFFIISTNIYISNVSKNLYIFNIFSFIIYVILITAVVMAFREGSKLEMIQFASELKKENIQQLVKYNEMVGKERHEFKNHLNTIYGLCTLNKPDLSSKIKQYINNYSNNSETSNINVNSGNDFVDAIVNVKYNNGLRKGIDVLAEFEAPLSIANIDENIVVTIISNIIENAFEAMINLEKDNKFVKLQTYIIKNTYYISIKNNGPIIFESDIKKIFNVGYSTKNNPSKTRGFGLSIVKSEISQCGGDISINSTEEVTEFLITVAVNKQKVVV